MGPGGDKLHDWFFEPDTISLEMATKAMSVIGAMICGRTTYDHSIRWWEADGPTGSARVPLVVLTHQVPDNVPDNSVYHFVTGGVEHALAQAKEAAGDRDIAIVGGADVIQQFLNAGPIDELGIHLVPVVFRAGTRLFDGLTLDHLNLEVRSVVDTAKVTHLRYRVIH